MSNSISSAGGAACKQGTLQQALTPMENICEEFRIQISMLNKIADRLGGIHPEPDVKDKVNIPTVKDNILQEINTMVTGYNQTLDGCRAAVGRLEDLV